MEKIREKLVAVLQTLETDDLYDVLMDFIDLDIIEDYSAFMEYLQETLDTFEQTYDFIDIDGELKEEMAERTKVVRNGHVVYLWKCPEGYKKLERGGKICVKIPFYETRKRSREMKIAWRAKTKRRLNHLLQHRKISNRRRTW